MIPPTEISARLSSFRHQNGKLRCGLPVVLHIGKATSKNVKPQRVKETAYKFLRNFLKTQIKAHQAVIFQKIHKLSPNERKPFCVRKQYIQTERLRIFKTSTHKVVVICVLCPSVLSVRSQRISNQEERSKRDSRKRKSDFSFIDISLSKFICYILVSCYIGTFRCI